MRQLLIRFFASFSLYPKKGFLGGKSTGKIDFGYNGYFVVTGNMDQYLHKAPPQQQSIPFVHVKRASRTNN